MADLNGTIRIVKRMRRNAVWKRDPACYGRAWVDLIMLAVDAASAPQKVYVQGTEIVLERGQVGWSQQGLAEEWDRSREWVAGFLKFLKDEGMIKVSAGARGTVITIVNYDAYQTTEPATDLAAYSGAYQTTEPATDLAHKGKREREKGNGKGESGPAEIPSDGEVATYCTGYEDLARGVRGIPEGWWSGWLANQIGNGRPFPRDWQRVMKLAFTADVVSRHPKAVGQSSFLEGKKNAAAISPVTGGRSVAQTRFELARELEQVRERLDACHETTTEPMPGDPAREKELEAQIAALAVQTTG